MAIDAKNTDKGTIAALAAAGSGTVTSSDIMNPTGSGVRVSINVSAISGTSATLVVKVQGKDVASGTYYDIMTGPNITATGFTSMVIYPGITQSNSSTVRSDLVPEWYRISYTITGTTPSVTGTIGVCSQI